MMIHDETLGNEGFPHLLLKQLILSCSLGI